MSGRGRLFGLAFLLAAGVALAVAVSVRRVGTPLPSSLAPAFQLLGTPVKSIDHLVTRVVLVNELDERELGEVYRARYETPALKNDSDFVYLNDVMSHLPAAARKPFRYRVYPVDSAEPNAMALPGGVILVTRGLLQTLGSEAELVSVLAHEMGHIEQGHCLDAVKFQLVAEKMGAGMLGTIADFGTQVLMSHSFSKTQEDEADEYAYAVLLSSRYDPRGEGRAFASLLDYQRRAPESATESRGLDPIRDYFLSHPPVEIREAKFREQADAWWRIHPNEARQVGERNLRDRICIYGRGAATVP
jgi:predicted Zn-dependent protease